MRLKRHRADVKYLSNGEWIYPEYAKLIARRYLNLIRAYELLENYRNSLNMTYRSPTEKRVLKDAGLDK